MKQGDLAHSLWVDLGRAGLTGWVREFQFALPERRWRFDLALPERLLAIEVQGATWTGGRHSRGAGQIEEYAKLNEAAARGWRILYFDSRTIRPAPKPRGPARTAAEARRRELYGSAVEMVRRVLG